MSELLRVTETIRLCGLSDEEMGDETAMLRGTYVHEACALDAAGKLNVAALDPVLAPYVESERIWRKEQEVQVIAQELQVRYEAMGYRGTLDIDCIIHGRRWIVDRKSGGPADWHRFQLCGYALAWHAANPGHAMPRRACLYLSKEGKRPKFVEFSDRKDFDIWKAIVTVANLKVQRG